MTKSIIIIVLLFLPVISFSQEKFSTREFYNISGTFISGNTYKSTNKGITWVKTKTEANDVSTESISQPYFAISPNPSSKQIRVEAPERLKMVKCMITDLEGNPYINKDNTGELSEVTLDISELSQGVYFVVIYTEDGQFSKKFVKQ
ncbi:MAG: T9SS type A sorting domain-containing protein [Cyclobacteriaceae bacterium]